MSDERSAGDRAGAIEAAAAFPVEPDVLWSALTEPHHLLHWVAVTGAWPDRPRPGLRFWSRSAGLGYDAGEYVEVAPPGRLVTRGLFSGRATAFDLDPASRRTDLRITVRPGPGDARWATDGPALAGGWRHGLDALRGYLEGRFDLQRFPYFGLRTEPRGERGGVVHAIAHAWPWAEAAGVRVGDRLVAIDDAPVPDAPLSVIARRHRAGEVVTLTLRRGPDTLRVSLRLLTWQEAAHAAGIDVGPPPGWDAR